MVDLKKREIQRLFPQMCDRFKLCGRDSIGEPSGFGIVWKAKDTWLDRHVAVKISASDLAREVQLARDIDGQTARIFDYFRGKGDWNAYVMELLESPWITLSALVKRHKYKPNDIQHYFDCFEIAYGILSGLADIHGRPYSRQGRYVHADIKPANIFLHLKPKKLKNSVFRMPRQDRYIKIIDLGITTASGNFAFAGTPSYDYPGEIERRGNDLYALAIVFVELLRGLCPSHDDIKHKQRISKAISSCTSGSGFVDAVAVEFVRLCARAATNPGITVGSVIDMLEKELFSLDPAYLLAIRSINKGVGSGLKKSDLAEFLFSSLAPYYGWTNRTENRKEILVSFVGDMYEQSMLFRNGYSYFVR